MIIDCVAERSIYLNDYLYGITQPNSVQALGDSHKSEPERFFFPCSPVKMIVDVIPHTRKHLVDTTVWL